MKKTKRFVLTSAIVASLAMGVTTTATTAQTSQAAGLLDSIQNIFNNSSQTATTNGVNISNYGDDDVIILPAGTTPSTETVTTALGGTPTLMGLVPATVKSVDTTNKTITFGVDLSALGSIGTTLGNLVPGKTVHYEYASTLTFKNGTTTANVKKGDSGFDLGDINNYKIDGDASSIEVVDNGNFNYDYASSYVATVKAVDANNDKLSSADTPVNINVLDANWDNLNQTVLVGSNFDPNSVTATDSNGSPLDVSLENGSVDTTKVGSYKVTYKGTDQALDYKGDPMSWTANGTVNVVKSDASQTITFQDANSGDVVGSTVLTGISGQTKSVSAPSGYDLVNDSDSSVTLQEGNQTKVVKVVKSGTSVAEPFSGTVSVYVTKSIAPLYTSDGTQTSRSLGSGSNWQSDQTKTINGEKMYRVSTNEWVPASDVYEYTAVGSTITTNAGSIKALYSIDGTRSSRSLAQNTAWYTDRSATINGTKMYRVSTDEWVSASDVH